jgi:hypothetical protein
MPWGLALGGLALVVLLLGGVAAVVLLFRGGGPFGPAAGKDKGLGPVVEVPPTVRVEIRPAPLDEETAEVTLSSAVGDVAVGGAGRYLVLHLPAEKKLALFDASAARVVHHFPVTEEGVKFAACADKLLVLNPHSRLAECWDLGTFRREQSATVPLTGQVRAVALGSASRGPLVIWATDQSGAARPHFLDVRTLKEMPFRHIPHFHRQTDPGAQYRASADGRVFGCWQVSGSPQGVWSLVLGGGEAREYYEHTSAGHLAPGPDGKYLYSARGIFTRDAKPIGMAGRRFAPYCLPAHHGPYYLTVPMRERPDGPPDSLRLALRLEGDGREVGALPDVALWDGINRWDRERITTDKRIHLIPSAKLLVILPPSDDRLVLYRFDLKDPR